ncbi:MAG: hypothetical protein ACLRQF_17795 [Thomasclavelia ramosa]
MLLEAYTRLQMAKSNEAQNALDWIKDIKYLREIKEHLGDMEKFANMADV